MKNKKGQEGVTLTTMLLLILGLVVVVLVIIGFTMGWDKIFGSLNFVPGNDLQVMVTSCEGSVAANLVASYCNFQPLTLDGVKQFVNCDAPQVQNSLAQDKKTPPGEGCGIYNAGNGYVTSKCRSFTAKEFDSVLVNGKTCGTQGYNVERFSCQGLVSTNAGLGGQWVLKSDKGCPEGTVDRTVKAQDSTLQENVGRICCVPTIVK